MIYRPSHPSQLIFSKGWGITKLTENILLADRYALYDLSLIYANKIDLILTSETPKPLFGLPTIAIVEMPPEPTFLDDLPSHDCILISGEK